MRTRQIGWYLILFLFLMAFTSVSAMANGVASGATYYVDATNGNDESSGTDIHTPWKSLTKVNSVTFSAGDKIFFKAGNQWIGQLSPKGSGSTGNPIIIDMYGAGDKPRIAANGSYSSAVYFLNQEYWELNNLEVTNTAETVGDYRGISINGQDYGTLNHFYIRNCYVHDVTGEVKWIAYSGWDSSKKTGGIVFDIQTAAATPVKTKFNEVLIGKCVIKDCSFGGIIFKQWQGGELWGDRSAFNDPHWYPHTNVIIRDNYLSQYNTEYGCNTIYLTNIKGATVENNVCAGAGTCAIELYNADSIIVQKNETYDTVRKAGGADYNGIDADHATTNITMQYNYSHDNGDGILLCSWDVGSVNVRYNILQNNSRYGIYLHNSGIKCIADIYNNVIYSNKLFPKLVYGYGKYINPSYVLRNNIFYATQNGAAFTTGGGISYDFNCYYGPEMIIPTDAHGITADPQLVAPGTGGNGSISGTARGTLDGYKLQSSSPCIGKGVLLNSKGGKDFCGAAEKSNVIYSGAAWFDNNANPVNAHGGGIVKENGKYYWFGEYKNNSNNFGAVGCYSSEDLVNWKFEKKVLTVQSDGDLGPNRIGERPKVIKCPATGEYILFIHIANSDYKNRSIAYATCDAIDGNYTYKGSIRDSNGDAITHGDFTVFQDTDGSGYIITDEGNIWKLSSDYKSWTEHTVSNTLPGSEAPAVFKNGDMYYWIYSRKTGYRSNDNQYVTATSKYSGFLLLI